MLCPSQLRRAACLLSLCLLTRCRLQAAAAPLPLGEEVRPGEALPKAPSLSAGRTQWQALPEEGPEAAGQKGEEAEDLFQDVDPKALAAVLLQALQPEPEEPGERHRASPEPDANDKLLSKSEGPEAQPEAQRSWAAGKEERQTPQEASPEAAAGTASRREEVADLKSVLRELQSRSPAVKREESARDSGPAGSSPRNEVLQELDEYERLKVHSKRRAPPSEPWAGARKLRQQQHLEHQLLQRRYEELAESRRQAEEARRAAAEEERLADMASDLLLQYLLKDGEEGDDESDEEGADGQAQGRQGAGGGGGGARAGDSEEVSRKGSSLLFEDEEAGNVAEDKRSNEAPEEEEEEDDDDDIDPNTIDRLIELSSKLHLPADDVIDIINDVEKKKKEDLPEPRGGKSRKAGAALPRSKAKNLPPYTPPAYHLPPRPLPKPYYTSAYKPYNRYLPKQDEASWNEVLKGDEYSPPKWSRAQPSPKLSNAISPWTFQSPASRHYRRLPGPVVVPRDEYYGDSRARDEELENYLESVLLKHPQMFP